MNAGLLRAVAIAIAVAGAFDPAVTTDRRTRPEIAVVAVDPIDEQLADRVARELDDEATILRVPFAGAAASVVVGDRLPGDGDLASPVFAVIPSLSAPAVRIESARGPGRAPTEGRVPIRVTGRVTGARGRTVDVMLEAGGAIVDRTSREIGGDDARLDISLTYVPPSAGTVRLRVVAAVAGARDSASADVVIDVGDRRWAVLFHDMRASWMATFVRRSIERDPRFVVTSRVVTSRNVSTDVGRPPSALGDAQILSQFDAIVIGAPEGLSERDVAGLDGYLRRRGGTVIMLFDQRPGAPSPRLVTVGEWMRAGVPGGAAVARGATDSARLRASELAWPRALPAGAEAIALSETRPVIWRAPVGAGSLIVSGALDAWRFRDPGMSGFDAFWRTIVAEGAGRAPLAVDVAIGEPMLAPDQSTEVVVTLRDPSLTPATARSIRAAASATLQTADGSVPVRLWPDAAVGRLRGTVRVPTTPGTYPLVVIADGMRAEAPIVVAPSVVHPAASEEDLLGAWVGARGGVAVPAARLDEIGPAVIGAMRPVSRREVWHPMRSLWWLLPFVALLGAEWLWRRRRGLA